MSPVRQISLRGRLRRHHARQLVRAVMTAVVLSTPVIALAVLVQQRYAPLMELDQRAIAAATDLTRAHPGLRSALVLWQEIWQPWRAYLAATLVCLWTWRARGMTARSWWAWITMMLGWNLFLQVKLLVQRARPVVDDPVSHAPGYSFPSGHAANTAAICMVLVVLLWPLLRTRARRTCAVVLASVATVTVLLDRVYLGVHFPSDVTAGLLLAAAFVYGSWRGFVHVPATREDAVPANPSDPTDPTDPTTERTDALGPRRT
ncbi:phosphatase PAP2 family protein [Arsenicicoccus sp. MKL-02]|uniref:Phosphatase PAP2 family protein n=1 Tax=Arsenicicoccus cauae TaxID=2663847 RepID=A0A6I3IHG2_9MICO|nr:phosphatase PAP2 family protein [Arsenicicoccus cauae]MTB71125.1 phosphatase PAP2 family protein [Arsenicicoccus cauae]